MNKKKIFAFVLAAVIFAGGLFYAGFEAGSLRTIPADYAQAETPKQQDFSLFWDVISLVRERHVEGDKLTDEQILFGAIKGALSELEDPYTSFLSPDESEQFNEDLSGVFGGIGAEIGVRDDQLTIIAPLKGNPAEKVGLKAGDKILKIDATSTIGMEIDAAIKLIRGEPGTVVKLLIMREGLKEAKEFPVTRAIVNVPTLDWEMKGNIAYFKLYNFNANLMPAWTVAATKALLKSPKGIIIDVRDNPGGFLDISTNIGGWFVKRGNVLVREKFHSGDEERIYSNGNEAFAQIPVVVIVNQGSASASEILAGALKDLRDATIVGEKTFGKGSVQEVQDIGDGAMIKVSIAEWLTPFGRSINKKGIEPDVTVKLTEENIKKKQDPQLDKALQILNAKIR